MNRISNLPDEIIIQILSFLSTKEAALTSVLSKRWRNTYAFTSNLCFEEKVSTFYQKVDIKSFIDFVDRVLAKSRHYPVKKFTLNCRECHNSHVQRWISNVLRQGVIELAIQYDQSGWYCRISSMTLQRLTINSKAFSKLGRRRNITLDTPSLAYLDYSGFVDYTMFSIVNLDSLVQANLNLDSRSSDVKRNPTNLLEGLRNVEILNLSSLKTSEILYSCRDGIPEFEKLSRLSIATKLGSCWKIVPLLLQKSPNLDTLVIKGPLHCFKHEYGQQYCDCLSGYSFLPSCPVKALEITEYCGVTKEVEQLKHVLDKLPCLELVKVHACADAKFQFDTDLLMLPIAHKIQFMFYPYEITTESKY